MFCNIYSAVTHMRVSTPKKTRQQQQCLLRMTSSLPATSFLSKKSHHHNRLQHSTSVTVRYTKSHFNRINHNHSFYPHKTNRLLHAFFMIAITISFVISSSYSAKINQASSKVNNCAFKASIFLPSAAKEAKSFFPVATAAANLFSKSVICVDNFSISFSNLLNSLRSL